MRGTLTAGFALSLLATATAEAQDFNFAPRVQPEVRTEAIVAHRISALAMVGANIPLGYYVRAGMAVGAGSAIGSPTALALRADAAVRFLLDPFGDNPWGPYAGGGLTVRREGWTRPRAGLLFVLGVEGRRGRHWTTGVEAGLGEGARLAIVLRKARTNGR